MSIPFDSGPILQSPWETSHAAANWQICADVPSTNTVDPEVYVENGVSLYVWRSLPELKNDHALVRYGDGDLAICRMVPCWELVKYILDNNLQTFDEYYKNWEKSAPDSTRIVGENSTLRRITRPRFDVFFPVLVPADPDAVIRSINKFATPVKPDDKDQ